MIDPDLARELGITLISMDVDDDTGDLHIESTQPDGTNKETVVDAATAKRLGFVEDDE